MNKYDVIIFDLDGTLSNSKEGITKSIQYALERIGINEPNLDDLEHFIGPPLLDELLKSYDITEDTAKQGVEYYRERYVPIGLYETKIYPGTIEMLKQLKEANKYIAMATSKPQAMAEEVLRYLKIHQYFDCVMGAELHGPRQSKKAVLEALFEELPIKDKSRYLMVGDTCFDIDGASAVGIDAVGVEFGFGDINEMKEHGALKIVKGMSELAEILV